MIPGHSPYCTFETCFCSPADGFHVGGAFRRIQEDAQREQQVSEWLWAMLRPRIETLITETLIELESIKNGNSQRTSATDSSEGQAEDIDAAAAAVIDQADERQNDSQDRNAETERLA